MQRLQEITIDDVARCAGVSTCTASRVLNGSNKGIRKDAAARAEKIFKAAEILGYQPNLAARSMVTGRTGNMGFMLSDDIVGGLSNSFFSRILCGVEQFCSSHGYGLHVGICKLAEVERFLYPKFVCGRSVDGVILAGQILANNVEEYFSRLRLPCVCLVNREFDSEYVCGTNYTVSNCHSIALKEALENGHRRIGMVVPDFEQYNSIYARSVVFWHKQFPELTLCKFSVPCREDFSVGQYVMAQYCDMVEEERPTLIVSSDQGCVGIIRAMRDVGKACPEDISLISTHESFICESVSPALTSVWSDLECMGYDAARVIRNYLDEGQPMKRQHEDSVNIKLFKRMSIKCNIK